MYTVEQIREAGKEKGVGVYCKCGGIVYCCSYEGYHNQGFKKVVDAYFDKGYKVGRIASDDTEKLFICNCDATTDATHSNAGLIKN